MNILETALINNLKMKIEQALEMIKLGKSLKGVVLEDLDSTQVSARDALSFARSGIVIPEKNVFYDDDDIAYDEDIDDVVWSDEKINLSWDEKARLFGQSTKETTPQKLKSVTLEVSTNNLEIDVWLMENRERLGEIIAPIIKSLFMAEKMMKE